jgi:tetratricopeptide (TPR) repeat protein
MRLSDRLAAAREYVAKKPTDRFGLYALAMELRKARAWDESFAAFDTLLAHHPDYGAAYFHYGMAKKEAGDRPAAIGILKRGLAACARSGDGKTRAEIEGAIDELEDL